MVVLLLGFAGLFLHALCKDLGDVGGLGLEEPRLLFTVLVDVHDIDAASAFVPPHVRAIVEGHLNVPVERLLDEVCLDAPDDKVEVVQR